jgi:hypothetical protein
VYRAPDGLFVNAEIVRQGYGHAYVEYPFRYMEEFRALERFARNAGKGLWGQAEPATATAPQVEPTTATAPQAEPPKLPLPLPLTGDETSLTLVQANTREYIGRTFIVVGAICVGDYYNYGYGDAQSTHVSLNLREVRADRTSTGKSIYVYLRRDLSKPLVDAIVEVVAKGATHKFIRAKLTFLPPRYDERGRADLAELLDWQFLDVGKNWGPWARGVADSAVKPQPQPADDPTVYVTKTDAKYHRAGCRYLSKSMIPMKLSEAKARYGPCSVCKPPQ